MQAERLGDVVIAAERDAVNAVFHRVARGEEDDRDVKTLGAQGREQLEAVAVRQ